MVIQPYRRQHHELIGQHLGNEPVLVDGVDGLGFRPDRRGVEQQILRVVAAQVEPFL